MKSALFHFKQFSIRQQDSAMKIGTDGVLLGAWAILLTEDCFVLDIGTGTGLIALMLAQRYPNAIIDAVELNEAAALEAKFNFKNSPWSNRLNAIHVSVQDYALNTPKKYDHIVCNPPFYQGAYPIDNNARDSARNNASLLFSVLFASINSLLKVTGICSLIVPFTAYEVVILEAQKNDLFLLHSTKVKGNDDAPFKRVLLSFSREQNVPTENDLCLELSRNIRTLAHQELVKDFYLAKP
jgi:tRNA1Val (adenine37-N6)-methyltransferase